MKNRIINHFPKSDRYSNGQVFIIIAVAFLVLVAFVGLAVDAGMAYISYGRLAKAADAAALAAAAQFREGRTVEEMEAAAANSMLINGVDFVDLTVEVCTEYSLPPEDRTDNQLCPEPRKKLVRITANSAIPLAFLRVIGFDNITLGSSAIAEAASLDVVLVLDISESMAWDAPTGDSMRDPSVCNAADSGGSDGYPGECQPFEEVKSAASDFVRLILDKTDADEEEDRLAIVTFGNGFSDNPDIGTFYRTSGWTSDQAQALSIIRNLKVAEPDPCFYEDGSPRTEYGPCIYYNPPDSNNFAGFNCISCILAADTLGHVDYSGLTTTNIGGGLLKAGRMYNEETREDALWVVIVLTDGLANATDPDEFDDLTDVTTYPIGYCPYMSDHAPTGSEPYDRAPFCIDHDVYSRHTDDDIANYDADDYARDMADYVGCYPVGAADSCGGTEGQGAVIFTIGLGNGVLDTTREENGRPYGTTLLRYIAAVGDDGDADTDPCADFDTSDPDDWEEWCGNYYYSPGDELSEVFEDIASRVFTRLAR
jgi:hypothetical protein